MSKTIALCVIVIALLMAQVPSASADPAKRYTVTDYGAVSDGTTVNTKALQALIEKVSADGGGTVVVPAGTFMTGSLFFKKGVSLEVLKDGVLKGTINPVDYPMVQTRFEGIERPFTAALLNFDADDNGSLTGDGTIDGSGDLWMNRGGGSARGPRGAAPTTSPFAGNPGPATNPALRGIGARGPATRGATTRGLGGPGRPRLICISNSDNFHVTNLHLTKQAIWCLHLLYDSNVVVDNVNIRAVARIPSSDGIDVDSSTHVTISHCDIDCNDDDIALKSGKDADGRRVNKPTEFVTITDCTIGAGEGIAMGSEVTGSIRHVDIERCQFNGSNQVVRLKSQPSRGGVIEDITYRDCTFQNVRIAYQFIMNWDMRLETATPAPVLTQVRNVRIINCNGTARQLGSMDGIDDTDIQDVKWANCKVTASTGMTINHATDIDLSGLTATVAEGPEFVTQNAHAIVYPATQPSAESTKPNPAGL
jgi:polygalacturonase